MSDGLPGDADTPACAASRAESANSTVGLCVGDSLRLTKDIWDDGQECYPPGFIAHTGEIVFVRDLGPPGATRIAVSHEGPHDCYFLISSDEYETHNANGKPTDAAGGRSA